MACTIAYDVMPVCVCTKDDQIAACPSKYTGLVSRADNDRPRTTRLHRRRFVEIRTAHFSNINVKDVLMTVFAGFLDLAIAHGESCEQS